MTQDDFDYRALRIGLIKTLCASYEQEHDFDADEDPTATYEMLSECRAIADELLAALPTPEPVVAPAERDPSMPF